MIWDDALPRADPGGRDVRLQADPAGESRWPPWEVAWQQALYGPNGFYRRPEGPAGHFRTATHAAPDALAGALLRLAAEHGCHTVIDVGAGRGELLTALQGPAAGPALHGVDVVGRPAALARRISWWPGLATMPDEVFAGALVIAWELLDTVPCPILETDEDGILRVVHTDPATGRERLGGRATDEQRAWSERWWPVSAEPGSRIEVGTPRDALWAGLVARGHHGHPGTLLLAVDYAHHRRDRPARGTLSGYRAGRLVPPRPDGSGDLTAHVAIDAVAAAGEAAGARTLDQSTQAAALRRLGLPSLHPPPPADLAEPPDRTDLPRLAGLAARSREAELLDPQGLGGFSWLLQTTRSLPPAQ